MVIDSSALVAMLNDEPEAPHLEAAVEADPVRMMSTASYLETAIVIETRFGEAGDRNSICGCTGPESTWSRSMRRRPKRPAPPTAVMARADTARASTTETASRTHWQKSAASPCCSKGMISPTPTLA